jgi:hypothetical protein
MQSGKSCIVDRLNILVNPFSGYRPSEEVIPGFRAIFARRVPELMQESIVRFTLSV